MQELYPSSASRHSAKFSFDLNYAKVRIRCLNLASTWKRIPAALETEDLVQEALIKIWEACQTFDPARSPWPLVKTIANNAFKDACRLYGKYHSVSLDAMQVDALGLTLDSEVTPSTSNVNTLLDFLTARQKEIIKMAFGIDQPTKYSINEIAEELGLTRQTISSDKKKGLQVLEERHRQKKARKLTL